MTTGSAPLCYSCKHLDRENEDALVCSAFPDGIPEAIIFSEVDHRDPIEGDHGIQYEPIVRGQPNPDPFEEVPAA